MKHIPITVKLLIATFSLIFLSFSVSAQNVIRYYNDSKVGYKNKFTNEIIVPPIYNAGSEMFGNYALIMVGSKRGYIDDKGNVLIPPIYDDATQFFHGIASVKINGVYGFVNIKGETVIPFDFTFASDFKNELARVEKDGKWGFIDSTGIFIIPLQYIAAGDFSEGLAPIKNVKSKWGFIDVKGKIIIPMKYDQAQSFLNGEALVTERDESIMINKNGRKIMEVEKPGEDEKEENERSFRK